MVGLTVWLRHPTGADSSGTWCRYKTLELKFVSIHMFCKGCHDINWLHERPSLVCLRGQLVSPIRTLEVILLWIQLFTGFTLTDHDGWLIDDQEHCLRGRSIVMLTVSVNVIVLIRLRCWLGATASMWETLGDNVNIFTISITANANGIGVRLFFPHWE